MNTTFISPEATPKFQSDNLQVGHKQSDELVKEGFYADDLISLENSFLSWEEWSDWWHERYESLAESQKQEAIKQTAVWLKTNPNKYWQSDYCYLWYLNLIDSYGSEEQKQEAIKQTIIWLKANKDELHNIRLKYLFLVNKYGNWQEREKAIHRNCSITTGGDRLQRSMGLLKNCASALIAK
jgi:hypothetical protein